LTRHRFGILRDVAEILTWVRPAACTCPSQNVHVGKDQLWDSLVSDLVRSSVLPVVGFFFSFFPSPFSSALSLCWSDYWRLHAREDERRNITLFSIDRALNSPSASDVTNLITGTSKEPFPT
jgi:hypothetical protein